MTLTDHAKGIALSIIGVLILSPESLFVRLSAIDTNSLVFYRNLFPILSITICLLVWYRKRFFPVFLTMGLAGLLNGFFYSITSVTFVLSIQNTSVANTLVILSSAPVFAAIFSTWFLAEKQPLITWLVIGLSLLSIAVIAYGSLGQASSIKGDFFALLCAISTASSAVIVRKYRDKDLIGSIIIGCLIGCLFAVFYDPVELLNADQWLYLSLIGFLIVPAAFIMLTMAPRFIRSAEVQLIFLLEAILGPLWVWLFISETPSIYTLIGGALLLLSVFGFAYLSLRRI